MASFAKAAQAAFTRNASDDAQFGEPEVRFGSGPVTLLMPFLLEQKATNELLYTGDVVDANRALELGLVNRVVSPDGLEATVEQLAAKN
ncbi:enoyl-CoA hydratase/isomerase family protein [Saccharopolyspora sp. CA-218241]|uniref:enoyl-CoA hydratase/isomerase family protein n=1 Tax=Saccharopolyspora sp. CA-218241 TaxID=3240027 RepID=UPI003D961FB2